MSDIRLVDPMGRTILLHDHTWFEHIVDGHPEVAEHRDLVEAAITAPLSIRWSLRDLDCRLYYGYGPRPRVMIQAVVDIHRGVVKTAHLARKFSGGAEEWSLPTP